MYYNLFAIKNDGCNGKRGIYFKISRTLHLWHCVKTLKYPTGLFFQNILRESGYKENEGQREKGLNFLNKKKQVKSDFAKYCLLANLEIHNLIYVLQIQMICRFAAAHFLREKEKMHLFFLKDLFGLQLIQKHSVLFSPYSCTRTTV